MQRSNKSKMQKNKKETSQDVIHSKKSPNEDEDRGEVSPDENEEKGNKPLINKTDHEVTIVLLGKMGAGKSTLRNNLLCKEGDPEYQETEETKHINEDDQYKGNGVTIKVVDTIGLCQNSKKVLRELSRHIQTAHLAIYCVPVCPGMRFQDGNTDVMKLLRNVYGRNLWRNCIVVLTYSNLALEHAEKISPTDPKEKYFSEIQKKVDQFQEEIRKLGVKNVKIQPFFKSESSEAFNKIVLPALPAGLCTSDQVLQDGLPTSDETCKSWADEIYEEALNRMNNTPARALLQYRYGRGAIKRALRYLGESASPRALFNYFRR